MKIPKLSLVPIFALTAMLTTAGCSIISKSPDGNDLAAQSCSDDASPVSSVSKIVSIGLDDREPKDVPGDELAARLELDQRRSILSAQAAATNSYWQPLADAWALEEALARVILESQTKTTADLSGALIPDKTYYEKFLANVNIDFAAITKDTYCRISFVKLNIPIVYETSPK